MIEDYIQGLDETLLTTFGDDKMKFEIGDVVVVLSNSMGAGATVGAEYEIRDVRDLEINITAIHDEFGWWLGAEDIELVKQTPTPKGGNEIKESDMKFNAGNVVLVIGDSRGAGIEIGSIGIVDLVGITDYRVFVDGISGWFAEEDLEFKAAKSVHTGDNGMMNGIDVILKERGDNYGSFDGHAKITQDIKRAMKLSVNWQRLSDEEKEALEMVAHKIGRILNGNPKFKDSWIDCIGYLTLISNALEDDK